MGWKRDEREKRETERRGKVHHELYLQLQLETQWKFSAWRREVSEVSLELLQANDSPGSNLFIPVDKHSPN